MCILFCYINPHPKVGEYQLVLVNNRDEIYSRPAKAAHFWECGILAGKVTFLTATVAFSIGSGDVPNTFRIFIFHMYWFLIWFINGVNKTKINLQDIA